MKIKDLKNVKLLTDKVAVSASIVVKDKKLEK